MLKNIHQFILALLLSIATFNAFSAKQDTLKTKKDSTLVTFVTNKLEKFGNLNLRTYDTAITAFQDYDPQYKQTRFRASLGNIGSTYLNLVPYPFLHPSGFDYGNHNLDDYLLLNDSVRYYRILKTFTELQYEQGAKKETFFHAMFSRNIYRSFNLGFELRVMNAPGAYLRQKTNHINFVLTGQYFSKDKRYGIIANFLLNILKNNENGGIKVDSIFEQNLETNRQIFSTWLDQATTRVHEDGFYVKQYFNISRHQKNQKDTAYLKKKHFEFGRIVYSFQYNRQVQNYMDNNLKDGFYQNYFLDSTFTYDSITVKRIVNELEWTNPSFLPGNKLRVLQLEAHFKHQYIEVRDHLIRYNFIQYIPSAEVAFHPFSSLLLRGYGDYVFGDYNGGDMSLRVNLSQTLGKPDGKNAGTISLKGNYSFQKAAWFFEHYSGNNFRWDTALQRQSLVTGSFEYSFHQKITAGISLSRINHYVYLDTAARPAQFNKELGYFYAYLNTNADIWRFKFVGQFAYQTVQGTNVLRLPAFLGNLAIYFTQSLFHGAAILQPGLNFNYNTAYFADSYMPATRSFYLQDKIEIGNYLYMNFFINVKIQRARFFVMYSNFDSFFMGRKYFTVPHYPMQDGAFHFGIAWSFHD